MAGVDPSSVEARPTPDGVAHPRYVRPLRVRKTPSRQPPALAASVHLHLEQHRWFQVRRGVARLTTVSAALPTSRVAGPDSRGETIPSPSAQAVPAAPVPRPRRQWRRSGRPSQLLQRRALLENRCVSASRAPEACGRSSLATVIEAPAAPIGCLIQRRLGRLPSLH